MKKISGSVCITHLKSSNSYQDDVNRHLNTMNLQNGYYMTLFQKTELCLSNQSSRNRTAAVHNLTWYFLLIFLFFFSKSNSDHTWNRTRMSCALNCLSLTAVITDSIPAEKITITEIREPPHRRTFCQIKIHIPTFLLIL